jgi:hypothetical protein
MTQTMISDWQVCKIGGFNLQFVIDRNINNACMQEITFCDWQEFLHFTAFFILWAWKQEQILGLVQVSLAKQ